MAKKKLIAEKYVSALPGVLVADTLYYVRNGAGFDVYLTNSAGTVVAYPLNPAAVLFPIAGSAFPLEFDRPRNYGYPTALTGNITITNATAVMGPVVMVRINQATEPTYPAGCVKISGTFKPSVNNYYYFDCVYVGGTAGADNVYHLTISQVPV
jgi:hypothetical protein